MRRRLVQQHVRATLLQLLLVFIVLPLVDLQVAVVSRYIIAPLESQQRSCPIHAET